MTGIPGLFVPIGKKRGNGRPHGCGADGVKVRDRFVKDKHLWIACKQSGEGQPLPGPT